MLEPCKAMVLIPHVWWCEGQELPGVFPLPLSGPMALASCRSCCCWLRCDPAHAPVLLRYVSRPHPNPGLPTDTLLQCNGGQSGARAGGRGKATPRPRDTGGSVKSGCVCVWGG